MKRFLMLSLVVGVLVGASGCNSCRKPLFSWFNRGDSCNTCVTDGGVTTMMGPAEAPYVLPAPGATQVAPIN